MSQGTTTLRASGRGGGGPIVGNHDHERYSMTGFTTHPNQRATGEKFDSVAGQMNKGDKMDITEEGKYDNATNDRNGVTKERRKAGGRTSDTDALCADNGTQDDDLWEDESRRNRDVDMDRGWEDDSMLEDISGDETMEETRENLVPTNQTKHDKSALTKEEYEQVMQVIEENTAAVTCKGRKANDKWKSSLSVA